MLQQGTLQIAAGLKFGPALVTEMSEMRVKITSPGHEQFGAWREGSHDDLVFAVALACWATRKAYPGDIGGTQEYWTEWLRNADHSQFPQPDSGRTATIRSGTLTLHFQHLP